MKNRKKHKYNFWKDIPGELVLLCRAATLDPGNEYICEAILAYLLDHSTECDSTFFDVSIETTLRSIAIGVGSALLPMEFNEDNWVAFETMILNILTRAEALIERIAPPDYKTNGHRTQHSRGRFRPEEMAQRLNLYFAILYMYTDYAKLNERLERLRLDTQRNVEYLLGLKDAEKILDYDTVYDFHYPLMETDEWVILDQLAKERLPSGPAQQMFQECYGKYVAYLNSLTSRTNPKALMRLQINAEKRLRSLTDDILLEVMIGIDSAQDLQTDLEAKKKYCEKEINESFDREEKALMRAGVDIDSEAGFDDLELPFN